ncbi:hypothetical protein GLV89_13495 [Halomonas alkaliantarctica]|nr:hypothetical protein [Halomonas alkaliantarctica]
MKKLYLHIGSNKTGTTSIQDTFHLNRPALEAQGVIYPGKERRHHTFYFAAQQDKAHWPRQFQHANAAELEQRIADFFDALTYDFQRHASVYLLSTEYLFISDKPAIERTLQWLHRFFDDIEIVAFVRQPSTHYASAQQQVIKARHYLQSPENYYYPFKSVIDAWAAYCPVTVFQYHEKQDSLTTLADHIGIEVAHFQTPVRANASLCVEQMLMLEKIQKILYADSANIFKEHLSHIHKMKPDEPTKAVLKTGISDYIDGRHYEDIYWLNQTYATHFNINASKTVKIPVATHHCSVADIYVTDLEKYVHYECSVLDKLLRKLTKIKKAAG